MPGGAGYPRLPKIVELYAEVVDTREDAGMTARFIVVVRLGRTTHLGR